MTDLRARFRALDTLEPPDVLARSRSLTPRPTEPDENRQPRRRIAAVAVALVVAVVVGITLFALRGLGGSQGVPLSPGEIVRYDLGGAPQPLAFGDGAAWVNVSRTSSRGTGPQVLQRIDATTGAVTDIPAANGAVWPTAGEEGVWATCNRETCGGPGVVQLDPSTGNVLRSIPVPGRLSQIATGLGSVWVTTDNGTTGTVTRIDPASGRVVASYPGRYNLIGVGGGSVWVTRSEGPAGVVRLDPDTGKVLGTSAFPDTCTMDVTDTQVFVASCDGGMHAGTGHDELVALDARTGALQYRLPLDTYGQMRVAGGDLWLAGSDPTGATILLERFDPATGASLGAPITIARGPIQKGGFVRGLFPPHVFFDVGDGGLWLTDFSAYQVIRVVLPYTGSVAPTSPPPVASSPVPPPLVGTRWVAVELNPAESPVPIVAGHAPSLVFSSGGKVGGNDGCNDFGGSFTTTPGSLSIGRLSSTLVLCSGRLGVQGRTFLRDVQAADGYRIDGWRLTLLHGDTALAILEAPPGSRATAGPSGSVSPQPPRCNIGELRLGIGQVSEATGQNSRMLSFTNIASTSCSLFGYPGITVLDPAGQSLPLAYRREGDQMVTSRPPSTVVLVPGGVAYAMINKYRCDAGDKQIGKTLVVTLPGGTKTLVAPIGRSPDFSYCGQGDPGSMISISPFEPTSAETSAH